MELEFLKSELECDIHNLGQAFLLGVSKQTTAYINKTKRDMLSQHARIKKIKKGK